MGATNRPQDVDKAILRRMPAMFQVGLPSKQKRKDILALILEREELSEGIDYEYISNMTEGFSGSDLRELCRGAAMCRVRELGLRIGSPSNSAASNNQIDGLRSISMNDFREAIRKMKESKVLASGRFVVALESEGLD